jgi:putative SOS response-associated peptidase YedK
MCERFTLHIPPEVLAKLFDLAEVPQYEPRYNIAPGQNIVSVRHSGNQNRLGLLRWGQTPGGSKDINHSSLIVCSETVNDDPAFSHAISHGRCIVPASGFYEWLHTDSHTQPYYMRLANSSVLGFAGLWEYRQAEDGSEVETCCILTTAANEIIKPVHDRMPVILQPDTYNLWLNCDLSDTNELRRLYQPYPSDQMVAYPVPELVNNPRFDSASCIVHM